MPPVPRKLPPNRNQGNGRRRRPPPNDVYYPPPKRMRPNQPPMHYANPNYGPPPEHYHGPPNGYHTYHPDPGYHNYGPPPSSYDMNYPPYPPHAQQTMRFPPPPKKPMENSKPPEFKPIKFKPAQNATKKSDTNTAKETGKKELPYPFNLLDQQKEAKTKKSEEMSTTPEQKPKKPKKKAKNSQDKSETVEDDNLSDVSEFSISDITDVPKASDIGEEASKENEENNDAVSEEVDALLQEIDGMKEAGENNEPKKLEKKPSLETSLEKIKQSDQQTGKSSFSALFEKSQVENENSMTEEVSQSKQAESEMDVESGENRDSVQEDLKKKTEDDSTHAEENPTEPSEKNTDGKDKPESSKDTASRQDEIDQFLKLAADGAKRTNVEESEPEPEPEVEKNDFLGYSDEVDPERIFFKKFLDLRGLIAEKKREQRKERNPDKQFQKARFDWTTPPDIQNSMREYRALWLPLIHEEQVVEEIAHLRRRLLKWKESDLREGGWMVNGLRAEWGRRTSRGEGVLNLKFPTPDPIQHNIRKGFVVVSRINPLLKDETPMEVEATPNPGGFQITIPRDMQNHPLLKETKRGTFRVDAGMNLVQFNAMVEALDTLSSDRFKGPMYIRNRIFRLHEQFRPSIAAVEQFYTMIEAPLKDLQDSDDENDERKKLTTEEIAEKLFQQLQKVDKEAKLETYFRWEDEVVSSTKEDSDTEADEAMENEEDADSTKEENDMETEAAPEDSKAGESEKETEKDTASQPETEEANGDTDSKDKPDGDADSKDKPDLDIKSLRIPKRVKKWKMQMLRRDLNSSIRYRLLGPLQSVDPQAMEPDYFNASKIPPWDLEALHEDLDFCVKETLLGKIQLLRPEAKKEQFYSEKRAQPWNLNALQNELKKLQKKEKEKDNEKEDDDKEKKDGEKEKPGESVPDVAKAKFTEKRQFMFDNYRRDLFISNKEREAMNKVMQESKTLNESQRHAIARALESNLFLVQGPPGTGKSTTAIKLIEVYKNVFPKSKILASAYSNVAVDRVHQGALDLGCKSVRVGQKAKFTSEVGTLDSIAKEHPLMQPVLKMKEQVDEMKENVKKARKEKNYKLCDKIVRDISNLNRRIRKQEDEVMKKVIEESDVVCATCLGSCAHILRKVYFDLVIIDECTQATEPSMWVPISKCARQCVLIGDQKQLPPVIASDKLRYTVLNRSLYDRLIDQETLDGTGAEWAMLNTQFRMHPIISAWPCTRFYDAKVIDGVRPEDRPPVKGFPWPEKGPLAFVPVAGEESTGFGLRTSKMNNAEAEVICDIIMAMLDQSEGELKPINFGVVCPYLAQTRLIRKLVRQVGEYKGEKMSDLEVKSVDGFQGREKEIIIYSTTRCNKEGRLGFVSDNKRVNVALTRAKRGIIVVGDHETLKKNATWRSWIRFVERNKLIVPPRDLYYRWQLKPPKTLKLPDADYSYYPERRERYRRKPQRSHYSSYGYRPYQQSQDYYSRQSHNYYDQNRYYQGHYQHSSHQQSYYQGHAAPQQQSYGGRQHNVGHHGRERDYRQYDNRRRRHY